MSETQNPHPALRIVLAVIVIGLIWFVISLHPGNSFVQGDFSKADLDFSCNGGDKFYRCDIVSRGAEGDHKVALQGTFKDGVSENAYLSIESDETLISSGNELPISPGEKIVGQFDAKRGAPTRCQLIVDGRIYKTWPSTAGNQH